MTKTRLCVFDLDGTLLDTIGDLAAAGNHALAENNLPTYPEERYRLMVGNGIPKLIERASGYRRDDARFAPVFASFNAFYSAHSSDRTRPYEGMPELLAQLQANDIQIAVLSNKADGFVKQLIQHYFPLIRFAAVQGQSERYPVKPNPAALLAMLQRLNIPKAETVYCGDSNVDVQTAHNAGLRCIGAVWGFRGEQELKKAGADNLAQTVFDIPRFL